MATAMADPCSLREIRFDVVLVLALGALNLHAGILNACVSFVSSVCLGLTNQAFTCLIWQAVHGLHGKAE